MDHRPGSRFSRRTYEVKRPPIGNGVLEIVRAHTDLSFPVTSPRRWSILSTGEDLEVSGTGRVAVETIVCCFTIALLAAVPE